MEKSNNFIVLISFSKSLFKSIHLFEFNFNVILWYQIPKACSHAQYSELGNVYNSAKYKSQKTKLHLPVWVTQSKQTCCLVSEMLNSVMIYFHWWIQNRQSNLKYLVWMWVKLHTIVFLLIELLHKSNITLTIMLFWEYQHDCDYLLVISLCKPLEFWYPQFFNLC